MGAFWGLPDFGAPIGAPQFELFGSYEPGPCQLWPSAIEVGTRGGLPDVHVMLVRSSGAGPDYGVFEIGIERRQDVTGALAAARAIYADATIVLAPFDAGFIRLVAGSDLVDVPADLLQPSPIGWGGLDAARWNLKLSADSAGILKAGLTSVLPLSVRVEVEARGVAPRVACTAVFDPAALVATLAAEAGASRQIQRTAVDDFFAAPTNPPWLKLEGDTAPDRRAFAAAMGGRVRMQYGRFVPAPAAEGPAYIELAADVPAGVVRWDLSQPVEVLRSYVFTLDPFAAARGVVRTAGIDALYQEVTATPLALGFFRVDVQAFLPAPRVGLVEVGVTIEAPARPPMQPQADSHTVVFQPPDDHAVVPLRLPPTAALAYSWRTWADVVEGRGVRRLEGAPSNETSSALRLQPHDLPIDLVEASADPALLGVASLKGTLDYTAPSGVVASTAFSLAAATPRVAVALPRDARAPTMTIDAHALPPDDGAVRLGPLPARAQHVTLASFREFGAHTVVVACRFEPGAVGPFGVDLVAEAQPETAAATLFLTRDAPTARWSYAASSPFHAGYRWRTHPGGTWSAACAPTEPLNVTAAASAPAVRAWDVDGVHAYLQSGDPAGLVRYVPGDPTPQVDADGKPTLTVVDSGTSAVLAAGTRLSLSDAQRNDLEVTLLEQIDGVNRIDFEPAGFTVSQVTLSLADGQGAYQTLATTAAAAPGFEASFSVALDGDQRTRAIAAVNGTAGLLKIEYTLDVAAPAAATLPGAPARVVRTADVARWFGDGTGAAHVKAAGR
jgi:hypothetical protein